MKCKYCDYPGELEWPENYTTGRPIDSITGYEHKCDEIIRYACSCGNTIHQSIDKFTKREICSVCNDKRFRIE